MQEQNNKPLSERKKLLQITNLKQYFPVKSKGPNGEKLYVKANDGISLDIYEGETVGLVGESGCGKSTFGRCVLQLYRQTAGRTMYYGRDVDELAPKYVEDILSHLVVRRKRYEELRKNADALQAEYDALDNKESAYQLREKLSVAKRDADNEFMDIVQLIGGFILADDLTEVSEALLKEYKEGIDVRRLKDKIVVAENSDNAKGKGESKKTAGLKAQLVKEEAELAEARNHIYELMKKYNSHPDWNKYEIYRDKGINLALLTKEEMRVLRKDLQLIFQDPYSSLNPRMTVGQIIGEGLLAHKFFNGRDAKMQEYILDVMDKCGLAPYFIHRYPHQFSGGQRQRIGIARSLALKPKFVVCDEAVSALDVSIQSQIINLLLDLKEQQNLTYLFISHDLSVIKYISDRVGVMYLGNLVELADTEELFAHPTHPYTEALLSAIPTTDTDGENKERILLEGDIPSPINPPKGCKFNTRCRYCTEICKNVTPEWEEVRPGHFVACHNKLNN